MGGDDRARGKNRAGFVEHGCPVQLEDNPELTDLLESKFPLRVCFENVKFFVQSGPSRNEKREILRGVNGYFREKSLNAIIGPSGAGKSSLLNIVCGLRNSNVQGSILINGVKSDSNILCKIACYIPQDVTLLPWLTARETLYFSARLKIPKLHFKSYDGIVDETAMKLGLLECLQTTAANLSGGEKKRLSIGVEIVVKPIFLVLDEPTSGLDSAASSQLIALLKNLAESGCTVACAIHQPSSLMMSMFDDILVLADGRTVYSGPRIDLVGTLEKAGFDCPSFYNVGEYVIEVATGQRNGDTVLLKKLNDHALLSLMNHHPNISMNNLLQCQEGSFKKKPRYFYDEFIILLWRSSMCIRRDSTMTKLRLIAHIVVALLLGIVFWHFGDEGSKTLSNISCLFFFLLFLFFANAMPAVQMFPIEAAVFTRELFNNWYSLWTYYLAKIITDLPIQILCPTFFLLIAYPMTGQPLEFGRISQAWLVCFLLGILAQSFGILTGATFNTHIGCFLVPALNIPMFLFAGFFLKLNETPVYLRALRDMSFFRYAFEGILQAVYLNRKPLKCSTDFCILKSPKLILTHLDMPSTSFMTIILALVAWILCLHSLIYMVLRWRLIRYIK